MIKIKNVAAYFCKNYPYKEEISKARLTKMIYLADWFSALNTGSQITKIKWLFNHYGPYVDDVIDVVKSDSRFTISSDTTIYGSYKEKIVFVGADKDIEISQDEKEILDFVINKTQNLYFNDFINYVYSTYPVSNKRRYSTLDLASLAKEYKESVANG